MPEVNYETTTTAPWLEQQPYLTYGWDQARNLLNQGGRDFYPGQTYVPFSPQTEMGLGLTEDRALAGSPVNRAASGQLTDTLSGAYLNSNPYLDQTYDYAADAVTRNYRNAVAPGIDSRAINSGRFGSEFNRTMRNDAQDNLGRTLGGMGANIYGGNYQAERDRQMQGLQMAPGIANQDYYDYDRLLGVGQATEGKAGEQLQSDIDRFNFYQNEPYAATSSYLNSISGNVGSQQTSPYYQNTPWENAIGGGMAGSQLFPKSPWLGAAGGAILGGLFG